MPGCAAQSTESGKCTSTRMRAARWRRGFSSDTLRARGRRRTLPIEPQRRHALRRHRDTNPAHGRVRFTAAVRPITGARRSCRTNHKLWIFAQNEITLPLEDWVYGRISVIKSLQETWLLPSPRCNAHRTIFPDLQTPIRRHRRANDLEAFCRRANHSRKPWIAVVGNDLVAPSPVRVYKDSKHRVHTLKRQPRRIIHLSPTRV